MTTQAIPGQMTSADVALHLKRGGFTPMTFDGHMPAQPDRLIIVAPTGGPGLALENIYDNVTFQLRTRGRPNDPADAENYAAAADRYLIDTAVPAWVGSAWVNRITRTGGPPAFLLRDNARRVHLTCSYVFSAARY